MGVVIQLAKLSGFSPILTTVSPHNDALVTSLGATHPIDRSLPLASLASHPVLATKKPLLVFDAVSAAETQQAGWELVAPGGTLVVVNPVNLPNPESAEGEGKTAVFTLGTVHIDVNRKVGEGMYAVLEGLLERGDVKVCSLLRIERKGG